LFLLRLIFKNRPIRNKNSLWRPCLLMDRDKMSKVYRGPCIYASLNNFYYLTCLIVFFSSPCQRQCELLRSLGARRLLTFHILIFSSKLRCQMNWNCGRSVVFSKYSGFFTNKTDRQDITEILFNVALNIWTLTLIYCMVIRFTSAYTSNQYLEKKS
jgi:hypothetical protein